MIITALIGFPTSHSVSPALFSIYAKEFDLEYSHLKIDVSAKNLGKAIEAVRVLDIKGLNVTLPYKMDVIRYLEVVDDGAIEVGAVNTIVNKNGILYGYNTDSYGALTSIKDHLPELASKKVLIFGTGGAARALVTGFLKYKTSITVVYRDPKSVRTKSIVKSFNKKVKFIVNSELNLIQGISESDIICNATSCGMVPQLTKSPVSYGVLKKTSSISDFSSKLFFDTIFNPYQTRFLNESKKLGADVQGGTEMMIYQGVKAFELWTGYKVSRKSTEKAKKVLRRYLYKPNEKQN